MDFQVTRAVTAGPGRVPIIGRGSRHVADMRVRYFEMTQFHRKHVWCWQHDPSAQEMRMQVTPYLYCKGACESALKFYEACGLGKIRELRRYEGTPMAERHGGAWREKVLHSVLEGPGLRLCASDGSDSEPMKGCAIFMEDDDPVAARALFDALSAGGRVTVPFQQQFWGDRYGNFTDKFGVQWAVNSRPNA